MHNESPDRLFDPVFDDPNAQLSPVESRIRASLFESDVPPHPEWLLELASSEDSFSGESFSGESFSVEEELSRFADELPPVRLSLRYEFLAELDRLDQKRRRIRQATLAAACLFIAGLAPLFSLLPASAQPVVRLEQKERVTSPLDILRINGPALPLVAENSSTDSWAMVDAYNEFESERRDRLRRGLTSDFFNGQMLLARPTQ